MRTLQTAFEEFEKAKIKFSQQVADFASKPQNIDNLNQLGVMKQLRPLLLDPTVSIQNNAALALGRIANHSERLAEAVVENHVLPQLVNSLATQNVPLLTVRSFTRRPPASCCGRWPNTQAPSPRPSSTAEL